jgi:hypothetical protein
VVFTPVVTRLLSPRRTGVAESFLLVMGLAVNQYLLKWMYSPDQFRFPDELQHWLATTVVMESGQLFRPNQALPPAVHFPGLAEMGAAVAELTGLPVAATRAYQLLSGGRLAASLAGPALTGIVLVALLRRRRQALAAVAGAVLVIGWGVLALRVAGLGLSPLTIGIGSLTAAVGAEFTVFALERRAAGLGAPWPGVLAAALTSAAGFASLSLSRLEMLREFGLVLAGSVLLALAAARLVVGPPVGARALPGPDAGSLPTTADSGPAPLGVLPR